MASVLIVEDHHIVAKAVEDTLSARGHEVVGHCSHADQVLEVAAEVDHDLVLMNLCMERQYGIGAAGYLHKAATSEELVDAVQTVAAGAEYWPAD